MGCPAKCGSANLWGVIRNPTYYSKIEIAKFKDEEAYLVEGQHEADYIRLLLNLRLLLHLSPMQQYRLRKCLFFNRKSMLDLPKCPVAPVTKIIFLLFC